MFCLEQKLEYGDTTENDNFLRMMNSFRGLTDGMINRRKSLTL